MYDARIRTGEFPEGIQSLELNISIKRIMTGSAVRMTAALVGTSLLMYAVTLLPGLFFIVLPGVIALVGKVYDEAKLIQYLKYGDPIRTEHWEDTETYTERILVKSSDNRSINMNF